MRRILLPLLTLFLLGFVPQGESEVSTVRRWIDAVLAHHPGSLDAALIAVAAEPPETFGTVARYLKPVLEHDFPMKPEARNDVRRRGALLHTDIALLLPEQAAEFRVRPEVNVRAPGSLQRLRPFLMAQSDTLILSKDGEYKNSIHETAHWAFASTLLRGVTPAPATDEFVRLWYRAIAATFQDVYQLGTATYHMDRALTTLPGDPVLLFYAGAMSEALASPRFQNIPLTAQSAPQSVSLPSEEDELHMAEQHLREAVRFGAPPEASLRLGRVLGSLGKHGEAVLLLQQMIPPDGDTRLDYFRSLFFGTELGAVGRLDPARESLERAAALFPTAQAPLIAMSEMYRRAGQRTAALDAIRRLEALPADARKRVDPWTDYAHSYAADGEKQLAAVYAWVEQHRPSK